MAGNTTLELITFDPGTATPFNMPHTARRLQHMMIELQNRLPRMFNQTCTAPRVCERVGAIHRLMEHTVIFRVVGQRDCAVHDPPAVVVTRWTQSGVVVEEPQGVSVVRVHVADSFDLIRVSEARENNLKDVSVEIPKRRLTVFTGVSGSGKSSLVVNTIAAESQRLINETYSAFAQGFMPRLARPEVDVLEGLTTAIIIDGERMGADTRSTVGTATDTNAVLRILFSRLGQPHIGSPNAFSFNVPSPVANDRDSSWRSTWRRQEGSTCSTNRPAAST